MSRYFGPLDSAGRAPPRQQTRVAAFLLSAHGALARRLAFTLPARFESAWQTELNAQLYGETEIVSLLSRATSWVPDPALAYVALTWETAWFPAPVPGIPDHHLALATDLTALAHAVHAGIRPAALLPPEANPDDPFAMALRRIEIESGRMLQAQILFLKGQSLTPFRNAVSTALERRHAEMRKLWYAMLQSVGISADERNDA